MRTNLQLLNSLPQGGENGELIETSELHVQLIMKCLLTEKFSYHKARFSKTISIQSIYPVSLGILFSDVRLFELTVCP